MNSKKLLIGIMVGVFLLSACAPAVTPAPAEVTAPEAPATEAVAPTEAAPAKPVVCFRLDK